MLLGSRLGSALGFRLGLGDGLLLGIELRDTDSVTDGILERTMLGAVLGFALGNGDGSLLQFKHATGHSSFTTVPLTISLHQFILLISSLFGFCVIHSHVLSVSFEPIS